MKKPFLTLYTLFSLFTFSFAQVKDTNAVKFANTITASDLKKHLYIIASDEYEGRETGYPGQKKAAEYISNHFNQTGLKPGNNGKWYQEFPLKVIDPKGVEIKVDDKNFTYLQDFYSLPGFEDEVITTNEIVFTGYGISTKNYDDYNNDVTGRVIMVLDSEPVNEKTNTSLITGTDSLSAWAVNRNLKIKTAQGKGARAVLIVKKDIDSTINRFRHYLESPDLALKTEKSENIPFFYISEKMADYILDEGKAKDVEKYTKIISKTGRTVTATANVPVNITLKRETQSIVSENVLGLIEGTDLKDEIIIITAHYDHIGMHDGKVFNGADDDGSGTVAILELAEAFQQAAKTGYRPRRSVLFMPVSGEEKGLLGSEYYSENPVYPLENTVANLNIDMIGRIDDAHKSDTNYIYLIGSDKLSTELHKVSENANSTYVNLKLDYTYNDPNDPNRFYYRSDHYNFARKNIPIIFYFNGVHEDYHKETDEVDKIRFELMEKRVKLIFYTAWDLANRSERVKVDVKNNFKAK